MKKGEKMLSKELIGKDVAGKSGKTFGVVTDLKFEPRTGEIIYIVLRNETPYSKTFEFERDNDGKVLIPFNAVISIGDFIVVAEEDII